jgi:hypothetical protein
MRLSLRVAAALLIGTALFAFPLVSPVPTPSEQLELEVDVAPDDRNYRADRDYQSLSADAKALFDEAKSDGIVTVPLSEAPEPWATQANESERLSASADVVARDGDLYLAFPMRTLPSPSPVHLLARIGSLAAGVVALAYGGYRAVNAT